MPDYQHEIHNKCIRGKIEDRQEAAKLLDAKFSSLPDLDLAWQDLHSLTRDESGDVRWRAVDALRSAFNQIPDKSLAWMDLIRLTKDEDRYVRWRAVDALRSAFNQVPDFDRAWQDLHRLTHDEDSGVRWRAVGVLESAFSQVPDLDLAWQDLHRLTHDEDSSVRWRAAGVLRSAFSQVHDKSLAWMDLIGLTQNEDSYVRRSAAGTLESAFSQVPDLDLAWQDLHRLTHDEDSYVRSEAASTLKSAFSQVPDLDLAWQDLHSLTEDKDSYVRSEAAITLGSVFSQIPDKSLAWMDLIRLTKDEDRYVRWRAVGVLESTFSQVPDLDLAWQDLHRLTHDEDSNVRWRVAITLGSAFSQIPDKSLAWMDLIRLTKDVESYVRMHAYNSLGKASISKAAEAKDKDAVKNELKVAIAYFEKSSQESNYVRARIIAQFEKSSQESDYDPSRFCRCFYRTYYAIIFQDGGKCEVQEYLAEAKEAVGGSQSKDDLLKAVENLAYALQESQHLKDRSIQEISSEINTYRWYCEKAADHMSTAENKAPGAVKLMRKCNPLLEEHIQATIAEIQKSAKKICQITRGSGTDYETLGTELQKAAKSFSAVDLVSVQNCSTKIVWQLKKFCQQLPSEDKEQVCSLVEDIVHEADFPEKLNKILTALLCLSPVLEGEILQRIEAKVDAIHKNTEFLGLDFNNIEFAILNLKVSSGNAKKDLFDIKKGINKMQSEIGAQGLSEKELIIALEDKDHFVIERLNKMQEHMTRAVRDIAKLNASKRDVETILKRFDKQDGLKKRDALGIISDISQLSQIALKIYLTGSVV